MYLPVGTVKFCVYGWRKVFEQFTQEILLNIPDYGNIIPVGLSYNLNDAGGGGGSGVSDFLRKPL